MQANYLKKYLQKSVSGIVTLLLTAILMFAVTGCSPTQVNKKNTEKNSPAATETTSPVSTFTVTTETIETSAPSVTNSAQSTGSPSQEDNLTGTTGTLKVHYIDIGQGDSILIQQGEHTMLIDAGERNKGTIITKYLNSLNIDNIDYLVGTHPHSDHIGGMATVIDSISVSNAIIPNKEHDTKTYESFIDALIEKEVNAIPAMAGDTYSLGEADFRILGPVKDNYKDLNDWSVVIKLTFGNKSFIFTGDAEALAESDIIESRCDLSSDVLKVGHHGSSTSTSETFLNKVSPTYAIISCAEENSYGHPHDETIELLNSKGIVIYGTYKNGTIIATCDGNTITFDTEK